MALSDAQRAERFAKLGKICDAICKDTVKGAVSFLGDNTPTILERFSSGCPELDDAMGGGIPVGKMIEYNGAPSSGKSTAAYHAIAEFQAKYPDKEVMLIDTEQSWDSIYAMALGVDPSIVIVCQPDYAEQGLDVIRAGISKGNVGLVVVDSVGVFPLKAEFEDEMGASNFSGAAKLITKAMRIIGTEASVNKTTIIWINQLRDKIGGVSYGEKTGTPGGHALKHAAAIRVKFAVMEKTKDGETIVGTKVRADVVKNKVAPPFKKAVFYISFGTGIDKYAAIVDASIAKGVVTKKGNTISFGEEKLARGRGDFLQKVKENPDLFNKLSELVKLAPEPDKENKGTVNISAIAGDVLPSEESSEGEV